MAVMKKRRNLKTVADVITAFGGPKELAAWAGVRTSSVSNWKTWGFIPPAWHYRMMIELEHRGFDVAPQVFGVDPKAKGPYRSPKVA